MSFQNLFLASLLTIAASTSTTQTTSLETGLFPHEIPDPLPSNTPEGVVNLFVPDLDAYAGLFEASLIASNPTSSTYFIQCASSILSASESCPFDDVPPYTGLTVTQGPTAMLITYTEPYYTLSQSCDFPDGTTATTALCTNYYSVGHSPEESTTPFTDSYTRLYSAGFPYSSWWNGEWGRPPFIPVSVTAGQGKAAVVVTSTSGSSAASATLTSTSMVITSAPVTTTGSVRTSSSGGALGASTTTTVVKSGAWKISAVGQNMALFIFISMISCA